MRPLPAVAYGVFVLLLAPACDPVVEPRPPGGFEPDGGTGAPRDAGSRADAAEPAGPDAGMAPDAAAVPDAGPQARISGTVTLWGVQDHASIRVELTSDGRKISANTDVSGLYSVAVPPGTYAARFTFGNYFPQTVPAIDATLPEPVTVPPVELRLGLRLAEDDQARVLASSPDASKVVHERNCVDYLCELWLWDEQDGVDRLIVTGAKSASAETVRFTPDGRALLVLARPGSGAGVLSAHFLSSHTTQKLAEAVAEFALGPGGTKALYRSNCAAGGCDLSVVELVQGASPHLLCAASSDSWFADDWKHALCLAGATDTLRLWDLTRWTSVEFGESGAMYSNHVNDDWSRLLCLVQCQSDAYVCDLWSYDAATGAKRQLATSVARYRIETDSAFSRAVFIRNAAGSGFEVSGELAWADLSTGAVSAIDSGVGNLDTSPDATKALYFKSWTGQEGDLWVWDAADGDTRRVTNPSSFWIGTDHSNAWAFYTPRRQPGWPDDLEIWNYQTRTSTFLGTYASVWGTSGDGKAILWIDGENAENTAGTLHLHDVALGQTLTMGVGVGFCNGKFMHADDGLTWAVFSGKCNAETWGAEDEMYAWSRAGGSRFLGTAKHLGLSPDKTKVAYLATDASGVHSLRLWDVTTQSESVVATGVYGGLSDEWGFDSYVRFNEDWSRVGFWGGCTTTPCDFVYTVADLSGASTPLDAHFSDSSRDGVDLNADFSKAVTVVGDPATVTGFDLTTGTSTVYAEGVDTSWASQSLFGSADRLLVIAGYDASTSTGELRFAQVGDASARTVKANVSTMGLHASSDWSAAFFFTDRVEGADELSRATGRFWSARLPATGAIRPLPVEDHVEEYFQDLGKWVAFRVVDPHRGGLYITKGP